LNDNNIPHLGQWWSKKMAKAQDSYTSAFKVLETLLAEKQITRQYLWEQWTKQTLSLTSAAPGMFLAYAYVFTYNLVLTSGWIRCLSLRSSAIGQWNCWDG
jgi:hypothetical protein